MYHRFLNTLQFRFGSVEVKNVTKDCHAQSVITTHAPFRFMDLTGGKTAYLDPSIPFLIHRKTSVIAYATLL